MTLEILREEAGIKYVLWAEQYRAGLSESLADAFVDEPLGVCTGITREQWVPFVEVSLSLMDPRCTVVALDASTNQLCGGFLCRDFITHMPVLPGFEPCFEALAEIDRGWTTTHPNLQEGQVLDLWMISVNASHRGKKIANHLTALALDLAAKNGYQKAVLEASGAFSLKAALNSGFIEVHSIVYKNFTVAGKQVFANVNPIHERFVILEKVLHSNN